MNCSPQGPLSMGFSRQEGCSGLPVFSPGDLHNPGIEPRSPSLQVDSLPAKSQGKPKNTRVGRLSLLQQIFPPRNQTGSEVIVTKSCSTLCNPMDYRVHGILQARILKWVAFPFSGASSKPRDQNQISRIAGRFLTSWSKRKSDSMNRTKAMLRS